MASSEGRAAAEPEALLSRVRDLMNAVTAPPSTHALRAAAALRDLVRWVVTAEADAAAWARLADDLGAVHAGLPPCERTSRYTRAGASLGELAGDSTYSPNVRATHPLVGRANPLAPPIELEAVGERAVGRVRFGPAHEGIPGCAHGGLVAAGFDIVLGQAAAAAPGGGGVTGTLTVRYRSPTPIGVDLRYEGWVERRSGRKIAVRGQLCTLPAAQGGEAARLCAEAEAIFVAVGRRAPGGAGEGG